MVNPSFLCHKSFTKLQENCYKKYIFRVYITV
jgi:hypothetical protein